MNQTVAVILTGEPGSGKTETALRFTLPGREKTNRLVLDYEARSITYHSGDGDDFTSHRFAFSIYPAPYEFPTAAQLVKFYKAILDDKSHPDVIIIDNIVEFQYSLQAMLSDKAIAIALSKEFGCYDRFALFLNTNFRVGDGAWWDLVKAVIRQFLLVCRRKQINLILTTELRNVWENFGSRDKTKRPKILGKTAKLLDVWPKFADAIWQLSRVQRVDAGRPILTDAPSMQVDPFMPKNSLVGVPPRFDFTDWEQIWGWIGERHIPTAEDFAEVVMPEEQLVDTGFTEEDMQEAQDKAAEPTTEEKDNEEGESPQETWKAFLKEYGLSEKEALGALGTKSVNAWIKLNPGKTLNDAITEITALMGLEMKKAA